MKNGLQAAQKELEPRRANYKDESGNLKAEFSFQLSYFIFSEDMSRFQQPACDDANIAEVNVV
jgi:hypothetical protein